MFNPKSEQIQKNLPKIKQIIMNDNVELFFVPSVELQELVTKNEHPYVKEIPDSRRAELISAHPVMIQKLLVWRWINGELDEKNSFILNNGDIRVLDSSLTLIGKNKILKES